MAPSVDWFYAPMGPGQISDIVAHTGPVVKEVRQQANKIGDRAASNLDTRAVHRSGDSHIEVLHKGDGPELDSYVLLVDPDGGAGGIEFGWSQEGKSGNTYGADGIAVLRDAAMDAVRGAVMSI